MPGRCAGSASAAGELFEELDRPALAPLAGRALRLRRVAAAPGRPRLPRRCRRPLLLGAAPAADPQAGRGPLTAAHRRAVPQGRARRRPSARRRPRPAHHAARAHAELAPAARRVDHRADQPRRPPASARAPPQLTDHDPGQPAAPRAGLPRLPRHPAAGAPATAPSASRRPAPAASTSAPAPTAPSQSILQERPRPPAATADARPSCRCDPPATSAAPATTIEEDATLLTHPTLDQLHQLGLAGMARAFDGAARPTRRGAELDHAEWLGAAARPRDRPSATTDGSRARLRYAAAAPSGHRRGCRLSRRRAASTARCSRSSPPAPGSKSAQNLIIEGPTGVGKILARLRARPQGLPRQPLRPLPAHPAAVRRPRAGPRRRPLRHG